jgi:hypothetical protein
MGWACGTHGRQEIMRTGFYMGRPDGKGPLVIPTLRWKDNIETNLQ